MHATQPRPGLCRKADLDPNLGLDGPDPSRWSEMARDDLAPAQTGAMGLDRSNPISGASGNLGPGSCWRAAVRIFAVGRAALAGC
eukprot:13147098-Alexandrium_andersonii.AAC.1